MPEEWHDNTTLFDMNGKNLILYFISISFLSCNNSSEDNVEKADSINKARQDSALEMNGVVIDENSSNFLVRAAAFNFETLSVARLHNSKQPIGVFVDSLLAFHSSMKDSIDAMAIRKKIFIAADTSVSTVKNQELEKNIIEFIINAYEKAIPLFENAILDAKEPEIRSFADKTIPTLRTHLASAKDLQKSF